MIWSGVTKQLFRSNISLVKTNIVHTVFGPCQNIITVVI